MRLLVDAPATRAEAYEYLRDVCSRDDLSYTERRRAEAALLYFAPPPEKPLRDPVQWVVQAALLARADKYPREECRNVHVFGPDIVAGSGHCLRWAVAPVGMAPGVYEPRALHEVCVGVEDLAPLLTAFRRGQAIFSTAEWSRVTIPEALHTAGKKRVVTHVQIGAYHYDCRYLAGCGGETLSVVQVADGFLVGRVTFPDTQIGGYVVAPIDIPDESRGEEKNEDP